MTIDNSEIRQLVRQMIHQALSDRAAPQTLAVRVPTQQTSVVVEPVDLSSDEAIQVFVDRILDLSEDVETRGRLRTGKIQFVHSHRPKPSSISSAEAFKENQNQDLDEAAHIDSGAVTETSIRRLGPHTATLFLGRRAVLTPLAKERARIRGIVIVREKH